MDSVTDLSERCALELEHVLGWKVNKFVVQTKLEELFATRTTCDDTYDEAGVVLSGLFSSTLGVLSDSVYSGDTRDARVVVCRYLDLLQVCALCKNNLRELSVTQQNSTSPCDMDGVIAWGRCDHCFHLHCISQWLKTTKGKQCPYCGGGWDYYKIQKIK